MMTIREDQLWDYAGGLLQGPEKTAVEEWLAADPGNRRKLEEIKALDGALHSMETEMPSMRFTAKVMEAWDRELVFKTSPLQTHTDKRIIYGIAALLTGMLVCALVLLFSFGEGDPSVLTSGFSIEGSVTGIRNILGGVFSGFGQYFIGVILLLLMLLVERYVHYRHYIRSAE